MYLVNTECSKSSICETYCTAFFDIFSNGAVDKTFFRIDNIYPFTAHCELLLLKYICLGNLSSNYALNVYVTYVIKKNLQHISTHTPQRTSIPQVI